MSSVNTYTAVTSDFRIFRLEAADVARAIERVRPNLEPREFIEFVFDGWPEYFSMQPMSTNYI